MTDTLLGFTHRYRAGSTPDAPTMMLLHGTGGDEDDLLPLAQMIAPQAAVLSPRGKVLEHGMPRFFRRLAEGVFDQEDLRVRTAELAEFVTAAAEHYRFPTRRVYAIGFSNGANVAASLFLLRPGVLSGGMLFRAMLPLVPEIPPNLHGTAVLLSNGNQDPFAPRESAEHLARLLGDGGAEVKQIWQPGGHDLTRGDVVAAREWFATQSTSAAY